MKTYWYRRRVWAFKTWEEDLINPVATFLHAMGLRFTGEMLESYLPNFIMDAIGDFSWK